ncbi:MAG TPA: hypothetical protein VF796_05020, partial [Humisphaera sp.]
VAAALAGVAAVVLVAAYLSRPAPADAAAELNRLIDAPADARDRVYVVRSLDPNPAPPPGRQPPVDGATLYVRRPDRYVLVRRFPDGRAYATGCDGEHGWSAPPDGAVRVSGDPMRFRGPLPGNQHGIPFVDLRSDLVSLREAYALTSLGTDGSGRRGVRADKRSPEHRGPRRVDLWYDPATLVIHRMVFEGLPKARGGPDAVAVELTDTRDLGPDFFKHDAHHAGDRTVVEED